ncbi:MAG: hypothetical protein HZA03_01405 [Nitrospinae bacterium]|nr:hypothetical protein [Nitrospinota bacterium]
MMCERYYLGICFVSQSAAIQAPIFGFSEFISALALLAIIYTVTDIQYKFRIAIAPCNLVHLTYYLTVIIGFGTLLTDIWMREQWLVPLSFISQSIWQGLLGGLFLSLALTWIYYAAIKPPVFSGKNYRKYAQELFKLILKGSESELPVIAAELARSAEPLVSLSRQDSPKWQNNTKTKEEGKKRNSDAGDYAHDVLLLIGNRKLCRHIIASSPGTAIAFFNAIAKTGKYGVPIGQFAKNISTEAINSKDSILYHEDEGYDSGLIGYLKPFSKTIYGNYQLVEALGSNHGSPLDIHYEAVWAWDASQLEAYSRAVLITLKSYLDSGSWGQHSFVLYRALENIKSSSLREVYKINDIPSDYYSTDIYKRFTVAVSFVRDAIKSIEQHNSPAPAKLRVRERKDWDFYDHIAELMFEIIFSAASVKAPPDKCWGIQHNAVWGKFFGLSGNGKSWKIVKFKLRRLLYDEILRMGGFPNYKSFRILGFCLNVMGLKTGKRSEINRDYTPLHSTSQSSSFMDQGQLFAFAGY